MIEEKRSNIEIRLDRLIERTEKFETMLKILILLQVLNIVIANPNFTSLMEKIFG